MEKMMACREHSGGNIQRQLGQKSWPSHPGHTSQGTCDICCPKESGIVTWTWVCLADSSSTSLWPLLA